MAAAAGSTLGIFYCFAASFHNFTLEYGQEYIKLIFLDPEPAHLLDYFIDRSEDRKHRDSNFTFYHRDSKHAAERLAYIYQQSRNMICQLPHAYFHELVLDGLWLCTDPIQS